MKRFIPPIATILAGLSIPILGYVFWPHDIALVFWFVFALGGSLTLVLSGLWELMKVMEEPADQSDLDEN